MDNLSKINRSKIMSSIKSKDTLPELILRSFLHKLGYRFRIHKKDLLGKPDITLPKYNMVIFVHGCFWHNHKNCIDGHFPKTNSKYWENKINNNVIRDKKNQKELKKQGWKVVVVWECEIRNKFEKVQTKLIKALTLPKP